jgi:uncharacterized phage-like protein YoqJ
MLGSQLPVQQLPLEEGVSYNLLPTQIGVELMCHTHCEQFLHRQYDQIYNQIIYLKVLHKELTTREKLSDNSLGSGYSSNCAC